MQKKLTVTEDEEVDEGLRELIGPRKIPFNVNPPEKSQSILNFPDLDARNVLTRIYI